MKVNIKVEDAGTALSFDDILSNTAELLANQRRDTFSSNTIKFAQSTDRVEVLE
jgi:hypothetical protein